MARLRQRSPATRAVGTFLLVVAVSGAVVFWAERTADTAGERTFAGSLEYRMWAFVVAASFAVWVWLGVAGFVAVHPLMQGRPMRAIARDIVALALLGGVVVVLQVILRGDGGFPVPVDGHRALTLMLTLGVGTAVAPWLISMWILQEKIGLLQNELEHSEDASGAPDTAPPLRRLLEMWTTVERSLLALAVVVSTWVLISGALTAALVPAVLTNEQFPSTLVLVNGAFAAALLAVVAIPLVLTWRNTAVRLVAYTVGDPPHGEPDESWIQRRNRMEALLHLDVGLLRSPIAALSVLSPLLTAAATAFIPGIP